MVALRSPSMFTEREYLALESVAEEKHDFVGGQIVAMAGAELDHNVICQNVRFELGLAYRDGPCAVVGGDQRVKAESTREYFYPDVVVVCGEPKLVDPSPRSLVNPTMIAEVLSPSTERYDRGEKWVAYQAIDTLRDYVLVASDRRKVEHFVRTASGGWAQQILSASEELTLSDGTKIALVSLYRRVSLPT